MGSAALGPRWVRATKDPHGHQRSPTVSNGSAEQQVVAPPAQAAAVIQAGDSDCGPEGPRRLRRAAYGQQPVFVTTGEPARKPWTLMTPDRASRRPLTWRFSRGSTVLNTTQFLGRRLGTDLARRKPGVQIPSPPPPTSQVRASPAPSRRRSLHVPAALGPQAQVTVQPKDSQRPADLAPGLTQ
jgi:hypothetical protein